MKKQLEVQILAVAVLQMDLFIRSNTTKGTPSFKIQIKKFIQQEIVICVLVGQHLAVLHQYQKDTELL